jgi:hypothetical protein
MGQEYRELEHCNAGESATCQTRRETSFSERNIFKCCQYWAKAVYPALRWNK